MFFGTLRSLLEGRKDAEDTFYVKFKIEKDRNYVSESDFDLYDDKGTQVPIEEFKDNSDLSYEVWFSGQAEKKYQLVYHDQDYDKKFSFEFHTPNQKSVEEKPSQIVKAYIKKHLYSWFYRELQQDYHGLQCIGHCRMDKLAL